MKTKTDMELVECLNGDDEALTEEAICTILERSNFDTALLLQPISYKYWAIAAQVLSRMEYSRILWLQDLNWQGALTIRQVLLRMSMKDFMPAYERAIQKAIDTNDINWWEFLAWFIEDERKVHFYDFSSPHLYYALRNALD